MCLLTPNCTKNHVVTYVNKIKILKEPTLFSASTGASGKNFRSTDVFTRAAVSSAPFAIPSSLQKTEQNKKKQNLKVLNI